MMIDLNAIERNIASALLAEGIPDIAKFSLYVGSFSLSYISVAKIANLLPQLWQGDRSVTLRNLGIYGTIGCISTLAYQILDKPNRMFHATTLAATGLVCLAISTQALFQEQAAANLPLAPQQQPAPQGPAASRQRHNAPQGSQPPPPPRAPRLQPPFRPTQELPPELQELEARILAEYASLQSNVDNRSVEDFLSRPLVPPSTPLVKEQVQARPGRPVRQLDFPMPPPISNRSLDFGVSPIRPTGAVPKAPLIEERPRLQAQKAKPALLAELGLEYQDTKREEYKKLDKLIESTKLLTAEIDKNFHFYVPSTIPNITEEQFENALYWTKNFFYAA